MVKHPHLSRIDAPRSYATDIHDQLFAILFQKPSPAINAARKALEDIANACHAEVNSLPIRELRSVIQSTEKSLAKLEAEEADEAATEPLRSRLASFGRDLEEAPAKLEALKDRIEFYHAEKSAAKAVLDRELEAHRARVILYTNKLEEEAQRLLAIAWRARWEVQSATKGSPFIERPFTEPMKSGCDNVHRAMPPAFAASYELIISTDRWLEDFQP
ncbi:hypothetical protein QBK99_23110 [Corticibacterium sp. UT-5YL-CI-8]|nr:hypothetical protein [Tianweitania sp. UT-5YL-CI-8]